MKEIKSVNNEFIKQLAKLNDKKERTQSQLFIIEGRHLVDEAYKANRLKYILSINKEDYRNVETYIVTEAIIEKISKTKNPQGIIGICEIIDNSNIVGNKVLILENINDPGNLGTLIRSAVGFNISTIIMNKGCCDLYNDKVIRASQGSIFNINIICENIETTLDMLKKDNYQIIGTSLKNAISLEELEIEEKWAIILGNEANGVLESTLSMTAVNVKIDINNKLESLNVAVAGSILMYSINNRRKK